MTSLWPHSLWAERRETWGFDDTDVTPRPDVLIVGAGYTGLWTAIHLKSAQPDIDVLIVDAVGPGFGASGRNGGWCSGLFPVELDVLERLHGRDAAIAMQRAAISAVDDVGSFVSRHSIDCDWAKSGTLTVATNTVQRRRLHESIDTQRGYGLDETDVRWIDSEELRPRVSVDRALGAMFSPHCAALHPMKLVDGLVRHATSIGVRIATGYDVAAIDENGVVVRNNGSSMRIDADWVVRATEGYTPHLRGERRAVIPLYSYMVATEPLPAAVWNEIGWVERETLAEGRLMVTYAQRSADGRIVFGGRGAGYHFASRVVPRYDTDLRVRKRIESALKALFPEAAGAAITHHWGGPLAVPRDWHPSVTIDASARRITAGGYVGDGVALSHLAGRTVAAAILGLDSPDLRLPLARHVSKRWEPEPVRWLGVNAGLRLPTLIDSIETRSERPARRLTSVMNRLLG